MTIKSGHGEDKADGLSYLRSTADPAILPPCSKCFLVPGSLHLSVGSMPTVHSGGASPLREA